MVIVMVHSFVMFAIDNLKVVVEEHHVLLANELEPITLPDVTTHFLQFEHLRKRDLHCRGLGAC
jgi:hypothetical protein